MGQPLLRIRRRRWLAGLGSALAYGLIQPSRSWAASSRLTAGGGGRVEADWLNLRGGPGVQNPIVGTLAAGTRLQLLDGPVKDGWWRIAVDDRAGYVSGAWLTPTDPPGNPTVFDLDLPIPFHRQRTPIWCDPADLQSWLEYKLGKSLGPEEEVQQRFWDWELAHNAGFTLAEWDASPFAIASAAHQWLPSQGFNHFTYDDPIAATKVAAWLLANPTYREPSVATIWRGDHYVLLRGVRATADPYLANSDATILGVWVMDPNQGRPSWLGEDRYIPMSAWLSLHLTPVTYLVPGAGVPGDVWQDRYVMVQRDWSSDGPSLEGRHNVTPADYREAR